MMKVLYLMGLDVKKKNRQRNSLKKTEGASYLKTGKPQKNHPLVEKVLVKQKNYENLYFVMGRDESLFGCSEDKGSLA